LEEVQEDFSWHSKVTRADFACDRCVELAIPWADLHIEPDSSLHLIAILADRDEFRSYLPENGLVMLQTP
jgi:hypothetical protein